MRKSCFLILIFHFLLSLCSLSGAAAEKAEKLLFEYTLNRPDGFYAVGEKVTASVLVKDKNGTKATGGKLTVDVQRMTPGKFLVEPREYDLAKTNPIVLAPFTSQERENVKVCFHGEGSDGHYDWINPKSCFAFGVAFGLDGIRPYGPKPADFDSFWKDSVRKAEREIPLDVRMELRPDESKGNYDFHYISFAAPQGRRVYGYYSVPKGASATNRYPARVEIPGAGWGGWSNERVANDKEIMLFLYVYPFQPHNNGWKDQLATYTNHVAEMRAKYGFYDRNNPQGSGMAVSREEAYFHPVLVSDVRAVKWLAQQPCVDPKRISYEGHSQGGGLGFALVGLCDGIFRRACLSCPALCDLMDSTVGRQWYTQNYPAEKLPALERNMPYYDASNFATLIHCPVRVAAGMCDNVCAPMDIAASYNVIPSVDKMLVTDGLLWGHGIWSEAWNKWRRWLTE